MAFDTSDMVERDRLAEILAIGARAQDEDSGPCDEWWMPVAALNAYSAALRSAPALIAAARRTATMAALLRTAVARDPYVRSPEMPGFPVCQFCMSVLGNPHTVECWWRQCQDVTE